VQVGALAQQSASVRQVSPSGMQQMDPSQVALMSQQVEVQVEPVGMQQTELWQVAVESQQVTTPPQEAPSWEQVEAPQTLLLHSKAQQSAAVVQKAPSAVQVLVDELVVLLLLVVPNPPNPVTTVDPVLRLVLGEPMPSWLGPPGSAGPGAIRTGTCEPSEQPAAALAVT
jgi:hypothetical protein